MIPSGHIESPFLLFTGVLAAVAVNLDYTLFPPLWRFTCAAAAVDACLVSPSPGAIFPGRSQPPAPTVRGKRQLFGASAGPYLFSNASPTSR